MEVVSPAQPGMAPAPGSPEELRVFERLQERLPGLYRRVFSDPREPRTVVVVPSLSLDPEELAKIDGVVHYEERLLCLLMLLRMPRTEILYVTSLPIKLTEAPVADRKASEAGWLGPPVKER